MLDTSVILGWFKTHSILLWTLSAISVIAFIGTLVIIPYFIIRIPEDYLIRKNRRNEKPFAQEPRMRVMYLIFKNLLGIILVVVGLIMFVIPGQGVITMLIGIMLMNFPGKHTMAIAIVRQPAIFKSINWTRAKAFYPPLILPSE